MSVSFPGLVDDTYNTQNGNHSQVHDIIYDIKSYNTRSKQYKGQEAQTKAMQHGQQTGTTTGKLECRRPHSSLQGRNHLLKSGSPEGLGGAVVCEESIGVVWRGL